jgi:ATP-binding cassette subfamily B protein
MVIRDGQIAESGNHDSLMQMDGIYHSMVTKRAAGTGWKN